jgi:uncharacterized membrane protein
MAMALHLQELHPALVHLPVALLPLAVGSDLIGAITGRPAFRTFGRRAIGLAALGAVGAVVTGLIAGEEVNVEGRERDMLMTHRNLNVTAMAVALAMATWRRKHDAPAPGYLLAGLAGIGVVSYTAYIGGQLVYVHGVGVDPAKGVWRSDAPQLRRNQWWAFLRDAIVDVWHGIRHMGEELAQGKVVPALIKPRRHAATDVSPPPASGQSLAT